MSRDLLSELNEVQAQAADHMKGAVMVIAGAGSGKTRVLTYRVARLIEKGTDAFHILCLTFTNKAAREMKDRIIHLVGNDARNVWMGTFHSIFARILRFDGHLLGYTSSFTIYDTDDCKSVLRNIVKELDLDPKTYAANNLLGRISAAKSNLISHSDYNNSQDLLEQDRAANRPQTGQIYSMYQNKLFRSNAMDFDDLLFNMNLLLRNFPEILLKYQDKFRYILVDEYQDTNYAQYLIVKQLARRFENICVVGDDAQSIYAFRGANIQNILNFKNDYPDYKLFKLEQNYRSTQNIVNAANSVISYNKDQIQKTVFSEKEVGAPIKVVKTASDNEEASEVANAIFELKMNEQQPNSAFAILYRTNAQSRTLEESLRRLNIPFRIYGGISFYARKEIKDMLAYFRLAVNPTDEEAMRRAINYPPRGIGDTTMQKITVAASQHSLSMWQVMQNFTAFNLGITGKAAQSIANFTLMIDAFAAELHKRSAFDLAEYIVKTSGIIKFLKEDGTMESQVRLENIEELLNAVQDFCEREPANPENMGEISAIRYLDEFLQEVSLLTDQDKDDENDTNRVSLMTVHQAKGLEFPYVFITGMEENLFPSFMSTGTRADLEEERRLFYVALTRAERKVTLSYADTRYKWGQATVCEPSRFIDEIDDQYIEKPLERPKWRNTVDDDFIPRKEFTRRSQPQEQRPKSPSTPVNAGQLGGNFKKVGSYSKESSGSPGSQGNGFDFENIQVGMTVAHEKFGTGKVQSVEGSGANMKASVLFGKEVKNLLLRFAKLKIVES